MEQLVASASVHGDQPFFDRADFPWTRHLEEQTPLIQAELAPLLQEPRRLPNFQDISPDQLVGTRDDRWKTFFFYCYGHRVRSNCARCPETDRLLRTIPGLKSAFFSILLPGKEIGLHRGPYNGVLRYHLGLKIPAGQTCGITVGGQTAHWQEGGSLIFDDTYLHKAWNRSNEIRAILFVDFRRPLSLPVSLLNRLYIAYISASPFITTALARQRDWDRKLEETYQQYC
jgi:beta-hydroxylase